MSCWPAAAPPPAAYVDGVDAVRAAVEPFTPELAERASGMPADAVRGLARDLAAAPSAAVHGRMGVSTQAHGVVCQWAVQLINVLTGNLDRPGGTMFTTPAVDLVGRGVLGPGGFGSRRSRVRGLPAFGGELPVAVLAEEITTPGEGQVRALLTIAGNPVSSTPSGHRLDEALAGLDAMVAIDFYVNETTRHADVILPPTGPLERDHYDLIFHTLAVRDTARWSPALFTPPPDSRHDWEIARDLGVALLRERAGGLRERWSGATLKTEARLRLTPRRQLDALLRSSGARLSVAKLEGMSAGADRGALKPRLPERLATPGHRIDLATPLVLDSLPALLADLSAPSGPAEGELLLIGRRHQRDNNSWLHNSARLTRGRPRHALLANPADLAQRGIRDGDTVVVRSAVGEVRVDVTATDDVMPGVVSLPHGYGHRRPGVRLGNAEQVPGVTMNDLTDPSVLDGLSGNAVLNGVPVTVDPRAEPDGPSPWPREPEESGAQLVAPATVSAPSSTSGGQAESRSVTLGVWSVGVAQDSWPRSLARSAQRSRATPATARNGCTGANQRSAPAYPRATSASLLHTGQPTAKKASRPPSAPRRSIDAASPRAAPGSRT